MEDESLEGLLASIRELVYPSSYPSDVIDLPPSNKAASAEETSPLLSEKGLKETAEVLSSFIQEVESKTPPRAGHTIESLLLESLSSPMKEFVEKNHPFLHELVQAQIKELLPRMLRQWMDHHLPDLVTRCVENQLKAIREASHQKPK